MGSVSTVKFRPDALHRRPAADTSEMDRNRASVSVACGMVAIGLAVWAVVSDHRVVVLVAAIAAMISVLLATRIPWEALAGRRDRARLEAEATRLGHERNEALEQLDRYQAEALEARNRLAAAMRDEPLDAPLALDDDDIDVVDLVDPTEPTVESPGPWAIVDPAPSGTIDLTAPSAADPRRGERSTDQLLDPATGLFSELFFDASLVKRVAAARRGLRPLTVGVAEVVTGAGDDAPHPADPRLVRDALTTVFRESDTLARAVDGRYLILLEDTPETGAIWTFERLRRHLAETHTGLTLWVGVSCYPAYGFDAEQLVTQAREALASAKEWRQDRVEVTAAEPDGASGSDA